MIRKGWLFTRCLLLAFLVVASSANAAEGIDKATKPFEFEALLRMATTALAECRKNGFQVTVVIVDAEGIPQIMLKDDHAAPHSAESAERKAYTAASFGMPTAKLGEMAQSKPDFAWLGKLDKVIFVGGGLPIRVGSSVVGGIGVAGGVGPGTDENCATAGLKATFGE